jgi:hypothetical protein
MLKYEAGKYKYDNLVDLQGAIMQTWFHQLPKQYFEKLALSINNRLQECIKQHHIDLQIGTLLILIII